MTSEENQLIYHGFCERGLCECCPANNECFPSDSSTDYVSPCELGLCEDCRFKDKCCQTDFSADYVSPCELELCVSCCFKDKCCPTDSYAGYTSPCGIVSCDNCHFKARHYPAVRPEDGYDRAYLESRAAKTQVSKDFMTEGTTVLMIDNALENNGDKKPGDDKAPAFSGSVLVCDDNEINRMIILAHLARSGLTVEFASNGKDGVTLAESRIRMGKPFDLILMDINMPVMDGITAFEELQQIGSKTPVVAFTSDEPPNRKRYIDLGMSDYLGKPYTRRQLWDCLSKYLPETAPPETVESGSRPELMSQT